MVKLQIKRLICKKGGCLLNNSAGIIREARWLVHHQYKYDTLTHGVRYPKGCCAKDSKRHHNDASVQEPRYYLAHTTLKPNITDFFKSYPGYVLILNVMTKTHQCAMFIKLIDTNDYEFFVFDPNCGSHSTMVTVRDMRLTVSNNKVEKIVVWNPKQQVVW